MHKKFNVLGELTTESVRGFNHRGRRENTPELFGRAQREHRELMRTQRCSSSIWGVNEKL